MRAQRPPRPSRPRSDAHARRFRVGISDGARYTTSMAAPQLCALMKSDQFRPGCFARIDKFIVNKVQNKDIVILLDVAVVGAPRGQVGAPTSYPDGEPMPAAATAALGSLPDSKKWHLWECVSNPDYEDAITGTIGLPEVALTAGKWFYEILIVEKCTDPLFGWARRGFDPALFEEDGWSGGCGWSCGEDAFSYGWNGETGYYLHAGETYPDPDDYDADRPHWSVGDVVGLLLDLDGREIRFSINGECHEFVFRSISVDSAYMPVLSMSSGVVDVNYGERELKFLPEGYAPVANWRTKLLHAARRTSREEPDGVYTLLDREKELTETLSNPDPSGALYVLSLLDKLDEAARGRGEAAAPDHPESSTSGWRRASVEDYGRAMRLALEELAESDRREIERARLEHETVMVEIERCREEFEEFAGCSLLDLVTGRPP